MRRPIFARASRSASSSSVSSSDNGVDDGVWNAEADDEEGAAKEREEEAKE